MLYGEIDRQRLRITKTHLVADTIDYLEAEFVFSDDWNGLEKWAHFANGNTVYDIRLTDDCIRKEDHLNLSAGVWKVYLHGNEFADGKVIERITTCVENLRVYPTGTLTGEPFPEMPASVTEQIFARLEDIEQNGGGGGGSGGIIAETDPTVPAWAKQQNPPTYTAADVGALPADTPIPEKTSDLTNDSGFITIAVASLLNYYLKIEVYNRSEAYSRTEVDNLISGLDKRLNAIADSTDVDLDQLSEIVAYIKSNKSLIDSITTSKVSVADIVNNLTTEDAAKPLSAAQGKVLKELYDALPAWAKAAEKPTYTKSEIGLGNVDNVRQYSASNPPPYPVTSVNGKTGAVSLGASDVGARPDTWTPSASDVGALPSGTKIPAKTSDITNDSGFITKAVADLTNYYTKSQTYTQAEINALVSAIPKFAISVVSALPTSGISTTTVYLVKSGSDADLYTEYIYVGGAWEILGSQRVDLTGYATEAWVNAQIADFLTADKLTAAMVTGALGFTPAKAADVPAVDGTLKVSGAAADAKVTGDKFTEVSGAIADLTEEVENFNAMFTEGGGALFTNLAKPNTATSSPNTSADEWLNGYYISSKQVTANSAVAGLITTNFIPVTLNDVVRIKGFLIDGQHNNGTSYRSYFRVIPYDSSGTALLSEVYPAIDHATQGTGRLDIMDATELKDKVYCFSPANDTYAKGYWNNVAYIRVCGVVENSNNSVVITINETITYNENFEDRLSSLEKTVEELTDGEGGNTNTGGSSTSSSDNVEILLPSELVAVVGVEFNIYYKSIILANRTLDNYEIKCALNNTSIGYKLFKECFRLTATDSEIGDYTLTVQVKDTISGSVKATKTATLHIIENRSLNPKNVLYIGDSLTFSRGGLYPAEIQYNLSNGSLSSIGTQSGTKDSNGIGAVKHEGYNGATVGGFLAATITSGNTNKFYNPSTGEFDLAYFMANLGETQLDAVCLNLGHNNIGNHVNAVSGLTTIAAKIHEYNANIPVIISLIEPLAGQDGWTAKTKSTAAEMNRHWKNLISAYITAFDNGKISNVYLSAPYCNIDSDNDFPTETVARSARDTTQIVRQNDAMHPSKIGTLKMADAYYAYLLYRIPEDDAVYYSVTNNLTNVSTNNSAQSVKQGTSYSAVLTPADGYTLDTVTVTMGGNPVTVTNGIINISAVTGNIIITATASVVETPSVPNLVDPSTANDASPDTKTFFKDEWVNGYYISSSSLSAKTGCITTNLFPITRGQKIKIEGIAVSTAENRTRNRWKLFDSSGNAVYSSYLNFLTGEPSGLSMGETSFDTATNTAIIDTSGLNDVYKNIAWARFSCYPAGANEDLIVSVVE